MKRILYFLYFISKTNYKELKNSINEVSSNMKVSRYTVILDMIKSSFKYKSSFQDYFLFDFYKKTHDERESYLTTGKLYEFHSKMNDRVYINNFRNKFKFNERFSKFIKRDYLFIPDASLEEFDKFIEGKNIIIAKPKEGAAGIGIKKISVNEFTSSKEIFEYLIGRKIELVEEFITQHPEMNRINPKSVNTIRIITVRWNGETDIIYAFLRIGVDKYIDNFSAGGIAAPIDIKTGIVKDVGKGKQTSEFYEYHPRTKTKIKGFRIPYWEDVMTMVFEASRVVPGVRTVGWDIAIGVNGPELIEGNDNWGKDAIQLLDGIGKSYIINKYK